MKVISLITNYNIQEKARAAQKVAEALSQYDARILVLDTAKEKIDTYQIQMPNKVEYVSQNDLYNIPDILIALGGDGSILDAARRTATKEIPVLGINLGRLGYMSELEMNELDKLSRLFDGSYQIQKRSMLRVELLNAGGELKTCCYGLNDAVISNGAVSRIVDLALYAGGVPVTTYRADGLIIATPTGSTAYSMSAGGAITDPRVSCFCVTPICSHSLNARPMIFPDNIMIEVKNICNREKMLYLTVDGRMNFDLYHNQSVRITRASLEARMIVLKEYSFYGKLCKKMSEF